MAYSPLAMGRLTGKYNSKNKPQVGSMAAVLWANTPSSCNKGTPAAAR